MSSIPDSQLEHLIEEWSHLPIYHIGRKPDNQVVIANSKISGQHARLIQCSADSLVLEDLDSKNGTFVEGNRITRKIVGLTDSVQLADCSYTIGELLELANSQQQPVPAQPTAVIADVQLPTPKTTLDYTQQFAALEQVYEQYPKLRRDCRNREKMIRTGSVILSSVISVSAILTTGGTALPLLHIMSGAGLSVLVPTLCSTLLSTDEKIELIDKEYRERYRCPNPECRDPFGSREWELLARQKTCRRCQAIWVN